MACGCNKNRAAGRPAWQPRGAKRAEQQAGSGNGARIVAPAERAEELANAARPPRARQPGAR